MTTRSKRSVDFREQPEIIDDNKISFDEHIKTNINYVHKSYVDVHLNDDVKVQSENTDKENVQQNGKTYISELYIDVSNKQKKDTQVSIEPLDELTKRKIYVKSHEKLDKDNAISMENKQLCNDKDKLDECPSLNGNNYDEIGIPCERPAVKETPTTVSKRNEIFSLGHTSKEIVVKKNLRSTETNSSLSYTSFPGHDNFILVEANDWLNQGSKFDKDGFALQSNFGHFDVKSKPSSRPWLSQFRKTEQRMYTASNGKVMQDVSVQDHDGKAYITSYHTNKELKALKPSMHSSDIPGENPFESNHLRDKKISNQVTCIFYSIILLGTLLVIGVTLLVVYAA